MKTRQLFIPGPAEELCSNHCKYDGPLMKNSFEKRFLVKARSALLASCHFQAPLLSNESSEPSENETRSSQDARFQHKIAQFVERCFFSFFVVQIARFCSFFDPTRTRFLGHLSHHPSESCVFAPLPGFGCRSDFRRGRTPRDTSEDQPAIVKSLICSCV